MLLVAYRRRVRRFARAPLLPLWGDGWRDGAPERAAAVRAEVRRDFVAGVGGLGDGVRAAGDEGDFAAVEAVAECLVGGGGFAVSGGFVGGYKSNYEER